MIEWGIELILDSGKCILPESFNSIIEAVQLAEKFYNTNMKIKDYYIYKIKQS